MTSTAPKAIRNVALALLAAGVSTAAVVAWKQYGRLDPYSGIAKKDRPQNSSASIQASGVKIRHYEKGKLVAKADAASLIVDQSRNGVRLKGIKNGVAQTAKGPMQFAAKTGLLQPNMRMIDVAGGVRVKGADFDIQTSQASINGRIGELKVPHTLRGTLMGGQLVAGSLTHRPNSQYTLLTQPAWKGKLPKSVGIPGASQDRIWDMSSDSAEQKGVVWVHLNARAADGEVIVIAPKIEQNTRTEVITATGRATYRSAKADMIADKVVVYRKEGRAEFTGNVVMLVRAKKDWDKPLPTEPDAGTKPLVPQLPPDLKGSASSDSISPAEKKRDEDLRSGKTLRDYPMHLNADTMTYWYRKGNRHGIAKGNDATARQEFEDGRWWRQVWAPEAHYDGEKDTLNLVGNPSARQVKLKNSIGDDLQSFQAFLSTKEEQTEDDEIKSFKGPKGKVVDRGNPDDPRTEKDAAPKKATPPPAKTEPPAKTGP